MTEHAHCPCGVVHEPYDGIYECPHFRKKMEVIAERHDTDIRGAVSKMLWTENVDDEVLGL